MREAFNRELQTFASELTSWADVVSREVWGSTPEGQSAIAQLRSISRLAQEHIAVNAPSGPVEPYTPKKCMSLAASADEIASTCPAGTIGETIRHIASNLRTAVESLTPPSLR